MADKSKNKADKQENKVDRSLSEKGQRKRCTSKLL